MVGNCLLCYHDGTKKNVVKYTDRKFDIKRSTGDEI